MEQLRLRIDDRELDELKVLSRLSGNTLSETVRLAIRNYLIEARLLGCLSEDAPEKLPELKAYV